MDAAEDSELDAQLHTFNEQRKQAAAAYPDLFKSTLDIARRSNEAAQAGMNVGGPLMHESHDRWMTIPGRRILTRIHYPTAERRLPALVFLHGGGWVWGSIDTHDRIAREYAARAGVAVVAPDYALAPEYPFPTALNECMAVVRWISENGAAWNLASDRIAVGGDSAGANLALAVALALRDAGERTIRGVLLNYAPLDPSLNSETYARFPQQKKRMSWYWEQYLQSYENRLNPLAAPQLANLEGLPPLRILVGDQDALAGENIVLAKRAQAAGTQTEIAVYRGMTHAFLRAVGHVDMAEEAIETSSSWLGRVLRTGKV